MKREVVNWIIDMRNYPEYNMGEMKICKHMKERDNSTYI